MNPKDDFDALNEKDIAALEDLLGIPSEGPSIEVYESTLNFEDAFATAFETPHKFSDAALDKLLSTLKAAEPTPPKNPTLATIRAAIAWGGPVKVIKNPQSK